MCNIRLAKWSEVEELNQMISCSARGLSKDFYTDEEIATAVQYVFGVDTQLILDGTYFVLEDNGVVVACGGWSMRKTLFGGNQFKTDEDSLLDAQHHAAKIRAFFVHPAQARKGYGARLLKHCELHAKSHGFSKFEMMATLPGVKLYEKSGYSKQSNQFIELPNQICLEFVHMVKNFDENGITLLST